MENSVRQKAEESQTLVKEVTDLHLPEPTPASDIVPYEAADPGTSAEIEKRIAEIDMTDTNSIVSFGSAAQQELQEISQSMLHDVRNKDVGPAGDSLRDIVSTIRGFSVSELDVRR
ncbi:MAG: toxic anion resistance protein, partial [Silicimonas sp.]|nr:toxic anion resistance protein [Silicimonas sp.]